MIIAFIFQTKLILYFLNLFRFYFLLLLACYREIEPDISTGATSRNISCQWHEGSQDTSVLKYDVWLVNGHPNSASNKLLDLDHQFSFEQQVNSLIQLLIFNHIFNLFV